MNKEELYKLSLNSYHEYPLLAELMAIRDERFKNEQQDSMLCVNGYVNLDTLNNYVKLQQENQQLKRNCNIGNEDLNFYREEYKKLEDNWNKLKQYAKDNLYFYSGYQGEDLETDIAIQGVLNKMQELERGVSDE